MYRLLLVPASLPVTRSQRKGALRFYDYITVDQS